MKRQADSQLFLQGRGVSGRSTKSKSSARWGSVLLLVVVVIAMLTLAAFNFAQSMTTEMEAASMYTLDVQSKITADSGVEFAAALLGNLNRHPVPLGSHQPTQ